MDLTALEVSDLRVVRRAVLRLAPGVNLFAGPNGSGKTSLLEAVHLLGTGRSFRAAAIRDLVRTGAERVLVRGRVREQDGEEEWYGVERGKDRTRIRRGSREIRSASELARELPLVFVAPEAQRLLTDGAPLRRGLVDRLLFHVEHGYHAAHDRYRRLLRQRNAALRDGVSDRALEAWDRPLVAAAEALEAMRDVELGRLLPEVGEVVGRLLGLAVDVRYAPGWRRDEGLLSTLVSGRGSDRARGFTAAGPHRADLRFSVDGRPAHRVLSRGEAKLFVVSIHLAEAVVLRERSGRGPILLVDDLASELDANSRERCFAALRALGLQALVTGVPEEAGGEVAGGDWGADRLFHVERGEAREVV